MEDTKPGSPRRAVQKALRPIPSPRPTPNVSFSAHDLAHMTNAQLHEAFGVGDASGDLDHDDNVEALDRAVHALIAMEMDNEAQDEAVVAQHCPVAGDLGTLAVGSR